MSQPSESGLERRRRKQADSCPQSLPIAPQFFPITWSSSFAQRLADVAFQVGLRSKAHLGSDDVAVAIDEVRSGQRVKAAIRLVERRAAQQDRILHVLLLRELRDVALF